MKGNLFIISILALLFVACHNDIPVIEMQEKQNIDQNLVTANKYMTKSEDTQIEEFTERRRWNMQKLDNGVRVMEYETGKGAKVDYEDRISISYTVSAISGAEIYSLQQAKITIGKNEICPGLDAGLLKVHFGSKARIIVPSHLGYGVGGDGDRIPQSAILIFDIQEIK